MKAKSELSSTLICKFVKKHTIPLTKINNLCGFIILLFTCRRDVESYCCKGSERDLVIFVLQLCYDVDFLFHVRSCISSYCLEMIVLTDQMWILSTSK